MDGRRISLGSRSLFHGPDFRRKLLWLGVKQRFGAVSVVQEAQLDLLHQVLGCQWAKGPMDLSFLIDYLDAERLLPVLVRKAA